MVVAGAGVAVVTAAGLASGVFSYHAPSRDQAAQEVRQGVPDVGTPGTPSTKAPGTPVAPRSPSRTPSPSLSSSSPSGSPSPSPSPSASHGASASASPTETTATISASPLGTPVPAPVLRRGDKGPEVTELQQRLRQLNLYVGEVDGVFTRSVEDGVRTYQLARGITGDDFGVYGPPTRASLEAETSQP
ncbi:peptidoglycan-binding protein [Streptomyces sp. PanSC9]|uniref:peptidoglycan-binding domain-containing protein n=1 Tax=Streptomyces sp. PanSC9 TaxID=1520461 RepID=UPI000F46426C|nr:peptidoglycan-binding domain-containing protein [Streptomyces sp. PanSC9]